MSYEVEHFERDVIEASHQIPVLVDFWAPWCGPCRTLGPVLERLASEPDAGWKLVKVNTDVHQDLAGQYSIRGIPAVKMIVNGQVVDEFTGVLPDYAIRQWLEKALPGEATGLLQQAESLLDEGDSDTATTLLEQILVEQPTHPAASALLARLLVFSHPEQALALAENGMSAEPRYVQMAEAARQAAAAMSRLGADLSDSPGREPYQAGLAYLKEQRFQEAIERFIEVLQRDRYYDDDGARKAGIATFTLLGDQHPVTRSLRRTFDMWLY